MGLASTEPGKALARGWFQPHSDDAISRDRLAVRSLAPPCPRIASSRLQSPMDRSRTIWCDDAVRFSVETMMSDRSGLWMPLTVFESTHIDEKNAIHAGGSASFKSTANHGLSLETGRFENDSQVCARRQCLTWSHLATSLPHEVNRGTDGICWPGGPPSCPPHHECPNPTRWHATGLSTRRSDAGRRR